MGDSEADAVEAELAAIVARRRRIARQNRLAGLAAAAAFVVVTPVVGVASWMVLHAGPHEPGSWQPRSADQLEYDRAEARRHGSPFWIGFAAGIFAALALTVRLRSKEDPEDDHLAGKG